MIEDGTYAQLFYQDAEVKKAIELGNLQNRRLIELQNTQLSIQTPINRHELWFNPYEQNNSLVN